ncbi:MAG: hypothetical protein U1E54_03765 [Candidatus Levybacteria bacterium]|nr:hypothetical protein [Candidatus Levybacteria bacterium]
MKEEIKVGDEVLIEQAWEDDAGHYHDEYATVSRIIMPEGLLKFRIGHWKTINARDQKIQAWLNQMEWYESDVTKV